MDEEIRWKIKKEISLGDLLAFISAATAVLYAYATLDKRLTLLEQTAIVQTAIDRRQDDDMVRGQARLDARLDGIDKKLDRLIERPR